MNLAATTVCTIGADLAETDQQNAAVGREWIAISSRCQRVPASHRLRSDIQSSDEVCLIHQLTAK